MLLGFKRTFPWKVNGEPDHTYFREKILAGAKRVTALDVVTANQIDTNNIHGFKPKLHTLRADPHDRWKAGRKIEMVYRGAGYKILVQFNKGIPELEKCVSTQKIEIKWVYNTIDGVGDINTMLVYVDGRCLTLSSNYGFEVQSLAANDGFYGFDQFAKWFNKDFTGKIIHWTDLRY